MNQTVTYYNLSQCSGERTIYLRSTDAEQKNWHRLLWSVPDELLYNLYLGNQIVIIDKSKNRGKIEHIVVPVINDLLNSLAGIKSHRSNYLKPCFELARTALRNDTSLNRKYVFWTSKFKREICIKAKTIRVHREENPLNCGI